MPLRIHQDTETIQEKLYYDCTRCGFTITGHAMEKRRQRGDTNTECYDCTYRERQRTQKWQGTACRPWEGNVDLDTMAPINEDGSYFMPGARRCGNADCVNKNHVITVPTAQELQAELLSTFYRTGKRQTYDQLVRAIKKEAQAA
jgi:hypothetical protein